MFLKLSIPRNPVPNTGIDKLAYSNTMNWGLTSVVRRTCAASWTDASNTRGAVHATAGVSSRCCTPPPTTRRS